MKKQSRAFWVFLVLGFLLFVCSEGWAAPDVASSGGYLAGYENSEPRPSPISWWSTFGYLFSLLLVFVLVIALAYLAARILGGSFRGQSASGGGRVLENLPLGPKHSVCAVELAGRIFLLGVTEQNIRLLAEVTDEEEIERLQRKSLASPFAGDFRDQISGLTDLVQRIPPLFRKK